MKRSLNSSVKSSLRITLLSALCLCLLSQPLFSATREILSVQVKQGHLRATPSFLGSITAVLAYGDKVEVIEDRGAWKMVALRKVKGWMHMSALAARTIALRAGKVDAKTGATSKELAIAGKGFNAKVEAEFKSKNKNIDYTRVDNMEAFAVKPDQMLAFLKNGQVNLPAGSER